MRHFLSPPEAIVVHLPWFATLQSAVADGKPVQAANGAISVSAVCSPFGIGSSVLATTAIADARPNIVVVLVNDLGFSDIGPYGSEVPTPNLDRLAAGGVRFTQFYNTPRCSPTRASLLTGLYSHQAGMGWLDNRVEPNSQGFHGRLLPSWVTIAEVLRDAGYFTAMTGKWHLGQQHGARPLEPRLRAVAEFALRRGLLPQGVGPAGHRSLYLNGEELPKDSAGVRHGLVLHRSVHGVGLEVHRRGEGAEQTVLPLHRAGPVHFPLRAPAETIAKYRGRYLQGWDALRDRRYAKQLSLRLIDPKWALAPRPPEVPTWESRPADARQRFDEIMAVYAAMIERIDTALGTLADGLETGGSLITRSSCS